jgi:hypothetical protein
VVDRRRFDQARPSHCGQQQQREAVRAARNRDADLPARIDERIEVVREAADEFCVRCNCTCHHAVRPEPVEGLSLAFAVKEGQGFDNPGSDPGPNGV